MQRVNVISLIFILMVMGLWAYLSYHQSYSSSVFPYFLDFLKVILEELKSGRIINDLIASTYRWSAGLFLAIIFGLPLGLVIGKNKFAQKLLLPYLNFFRCLSPLAWIPFAVIWFGIGDAPVIFLIFLGCVFPILFNTIQAVQNVPKVYDQLARDYSYKQSEYLVDILLPAILPQVVSSLRLMAGLAWIVLVPAEMLAGKEGLGFAIMDARNGLRMDLLVLNMIVIALIAHQIDILLLKLNQRSTVRWGFEQ